MSDATPKQRAEKRASGALEALGDVIKQEIAAYEFEEGEKPTDEERDMIIDAVKMLVTNRVFIAAFELWRIAARARDAYDPLAMPKKNHVMLQNPRLNRQAVFIDIYCGRRGWHRGSLAPWQLSEIYSQPDYADPGAIDEQVAVEGAWQALVKSIWECIVGDAGYLTLGGLIDGLQKDGLSEGQWDGFIEAIEELPDVATTDDADYIDIRKHDWWVFSTALKEGWLTLSCKKTGAQGVIRDPSKEEWSDAFAAPSNPYRWRDHSRVVIMHEACGSNPVEKGEGRL